MDTGCRQQSCPSIGRLCSENGSCEEIFQKSLPSGCEESGGRHALHVRGSFPKGLCTLRRERLSRDCSVSQKVVLDKMLAICSCVTT